MEERTAKTPNISKAANEAILHNILILRNKKGKHGTSLFIVPIYKLRAIYIAFYYFFNIAFLYGGL